MEIILARSTHITIPTLEVSYLTVHYLTVVGALALLVSFYIKPRAAQN